MNKLNPLVMIHGLLGPIDYFSPQAYLEGIAVHTPDLLGYGVQRAVGDPTRITLEGQARYIADYLRTQVRQPAWVLGHSVGGVVAMLAALQAPELVCGLISVEGNFTLNDAFWCRKIAPMDTAQWRAEYDRMRSDPSAWLRANTIEPTPEREQWARLILENQPASTVAAMARAVVDETGNQAYLGSARTVVDRGTAICLLAGQTSRAGWDVPDWITAAAKRDVILSKVGHLMMLEAPEAFCHTVRDIMLGLD